MNKYKVVRNQPFTNQEKLELFKTIQTKIPIDCIVFKESYGSEFKILTKDKHLQIVMSTTIINRENFELFRVIAIPKPSNRSIIAIANPFIAINHHEQYFYVSSDLIKLNNTHFLTRQQIISTDPDCISAAILHKHPKNTCTLEQLPKNYVQIIPLSYNAVLYYAQNPQMLVIHCKDKTITPPHYAAIVYLDAECEIRTENYITKANILGEFTSRKIFFKEKNEIPHQISDTLKEIEIVNHDEYKSVSTEDIQPKNEHWFALIIIVLSISLVATSITIAYYIKQYQKQNKTPSSETSKPVPRKRGPLPLPKIIHNIEEDSC